MLLEKKKETSFNVIPYQGKNIWKAKSKKEDFSTNKVKNKNKNIKSILYPFKRFIPPGLKSDLKKIMPFYQDRNLPPVITKY